MLPESRSRGNVGEMDVEEGVMIPAWWGVRSSHANVNSVQHSWHLASLLAGTWPPRLASRLTSEARQ